jgi:glyoxylase-like metal-dependent hydrolase (beta-lactamase superfamily II)
MSTERSFDSVAGVRPAISDVLPGVRRLTFAGVVGVGHVHCYLLRGATGWTLVDTGLGVPGAAEAWREVAAALDAPIRRAVITHMHVDHIGGSAAVAPVCEGPLLQGRLDRDQAAAAYGDGRWPGVLRDHFLANGLPAADGAAIEGSWRALAALAGLWPTEPLAPGDRVDGWQVVPLPGHADGHLGLLRDGVLVGGDALLPDISPIIGVWPGCDPDPLRLYLATLDRIGAVALRVVLPGHGDPIADPAGRARETAVHHRERLDAAAAALGPAPRTAYEVSLELWPADLDPGQRSFAVAEALAHLVRLVGEGRATAADDGGVRAFRAPAPRRARAAAPCR